MDLAPLFGLRLRTPRLELRPPTHDELVELRELARTGVHPPDFMPFQYAWTEEPYSEDWVVRFHEERREAWRPDAWALALGVWVDGALAGLQEATAKDFATTRTVTTGSWLALSFQGRGIGTEMRAAVLELAFHGLGARLARSGAIDGNAASLRVSERLGYRVAGRSTLAPQGVEVGHTDLELRREDWRCPVPVEIEGLEPCRPLFGLSPAAAGP
ncbi:MAG TPA: GNAT family protein [Gaiellaceae bacterium]|nr:GNAT family protein [Gaiellaceae bacterium]